MAVFPVISSFRVAFFSSFRHAIRQGEKTNHRKTKWHKPATIICKHNEFLLLSTSSSLSLSDISKRAMIIKLATSIGNDTLIKKMFLGLEPVQVTGSHNVHEMTH